MAVVLRQGWPGGQEVVRARDSVGTAGHEGGFPWPHHQPIHNLEHSDYTLAPLHAIPIPGCHPITSSFLSPPREQRSLCVPDRCESQRCPETASSRQPPPQAAAPTPPRLRGPRVGDNVLGPEGGGLATLGGLGKVPGLASEGGGAGGAQPFLSPPPHVRGQVRWVPGDRKGHTL